MTDGIDMGHGWVIPNPSGVKTRCGGPDICFVCRDEKSQEDMKESAKAMEQTFNEELRSSALDVCDVCDGRAWVLFRMPNVISCSHGSCPSCNKKGSIVGDTGVNFRELVIESISFKT